MPVNRSVPDVAQKRKDWNGLISGFKASGLTDGSWAVSTKKDPLSEIAAPGGGLSFGCADGVFAFTFAIYSICHSPQKSSAVQKVYRAGLAAEGRPVFVQPLRRCAPAPLVGEPLAKPFTLRGLPRPPLARGGGIASAMTERLDDGSRAVSTKKKTPFRSCNSGRGFSSW